MLVFVLIVLLDVRDEPSTEARACAMNGAARIFERWEMQAWQGEGSTAVEWSDVAETSGTAGGAQIAHAHGYGSDCTKRRRRVGSADLVGS